jgi:hypothetical protein
MVVKHELSEVIEESRPLDYRGAERFLQRTALENRIDASLGDAASDIGCHVPEVWSAPLAQLVTARASVPCPAPPAPSPDAVFCEACSDDADVARAARLA